MKLWQRLLADGTLGLNGLMHVSILVEDVVALPKSDFVLWIQMKLKNVLRALKPNCCDWVLFSRSGSHVGRGRGSTMSFPFAICVRIYAPRCLGRWRA